MQPQTGAEGDLGPAEWAALYANDNEPEGRRQEALSRLIAGYQAEFASGLPSPVSGWGDTLTRALQPAVRRAARLVTHHTAACAREEFVADSLAHICAPRATRSPLIVSYNPAEGPLERWLCHFLELRWRDRWRKEQRHCRLLPLDESALAIEDSVSQALQRSSLSAEPFGRRDLLRLADWRVKDRILLLSLAGLFVKVSQHEGALWERWLKEYEAQRKISLPRPFPPSPVESLESHNERKRPLGQALGMALEALHTYWFQKKELLKELECIQDARSLAAQ